MFTDLCWLLAGLRTKNPLERTVVTAKLKLMAAYCLIGVVFGVMVGSLTGISLSHGPIFIPNPKVPACGVGVAMFAIVAIVGMKQMRHVTEDTVLPDP